MQINENKKYTLNSDEIMEFFGKDAKETQIISCLTDEARKDIKMYVELDELNTYYNFETHPCLTQLALVNVGTHNGVCWYKMDWDGLHQIGIITEKEMEEIKDNARRM